MLQLRNTPDKDCKVSPAQTIFGKPLRDVFSFVNCDIKFTNPAISPLWRGAWMCERRGLEVQVLLKSVEQLNAHANKLPELSVGNRDFVQNQSGPHPNKWDKSGVVVECKNFDQYLVKIDGSGSYVKRSQILEALYTTIIEAAVDPNGFYRGTTGQYPSGLNMCCTSQFEATSGS